MSISTFVAGMPMNSWVCVPRARHRATTVSPPSMTASVSRRKSGKPLLRPRISSSDSCTPVSPTPAVQRRAPSAKIRAYVSRSPRFMASTASRIVSALLTVLLPTIGSRFHDEVHALTTPQRREARPVGLAGRFDGAVPVEQRPERDLTLDARQGCTEAEVHSPPERQVPDLGPSHVEPLG